MDLVIRAALIYVFMLAFLRIPGKRQFAQLTTFDFVLLLILSETISQPIFGNPEEYSLTGSAIIVATLISMDIMFSYLKECIPRFDPVMESVPVLLVENGRPLEQNMKSERIGVEEVLEAARSTQGLEDLSQVRYAVLEKDGSISIISQRESQGAPG